MPGGRFRMSQILSAAELLTERQELKSALLEVPTALIELLLQEVEERPDEIAEALRSALAGRT